MTRALLLLAALHGAALADSKGSANADGPPLVTPPPGFLHSADQSNAASAKANQVSHFGGARSLATADVLLPEKPGVALFVTAVAGQVSTDRETAARVEVDELHATAQRAALAGSGNAGGGITEDKWAEAVDPKAKEIVAELAWRDASSKTQTFARMVLVADAEHLVAVTGECVAAENADAKQLDACKAALLTLDPGMDADKRIAFSLAPAGSRPEAPATPAMPGASTMSDGSHTPLPPMAGVPIEKPAKDRRPVYVGLGIVMLAAAFWWNQRRRARFEKDSDD